MMISEVEYFTYLHILPPSGKVYLDTDQISDGISESARQSAINNRVKGGIGVAQQKQLRFQAFVCRSAVDVIYKTDDVVWEPAACENESQEEEDACDSPSTSYKSVPLKVEKESLIL